MGYCIEYNPESNKRFPIRNTNKKAWPFVVVTCLLVIALLVYNVGQERIKTWLLPGDSQITEAALKNLVGELKDGEPISDAFTTFCQEIIDNAQING